MGKDKWIPQTHIKERDGVMVVVDKKYRCPICDKYSDKRSEKCPHCGRELE